MTSGEESDFSADAHKLLAKWLDACLRDGRTKGKTNRALGPLLGVDATQVGRMRSGARNIKAKELPIIERFLGQKAPAPALGARDAVPTVLSFAGAVGEIPIEAIIAPAVWREAGASVVSSEKAWALPDPDLAAHRQYACSVEGEPNRLVICVPYGERRTAPQSDDLVHVVRRNGSLEEHTLWLTKYRDGGYVLEPEKGGKAIKYPHVASEKTPELRGLVVADMTRRRA